MTISDLQLLRYRMDEEDISGQEVREAVAARGYYPEDTPMDDYDPEFVTEKLVGQWDKVVSAVKVLRGKRELRRKRDLLQGLLAEPGGVDVDDPRPAYDEDWPPDSCVRGMAGYGRKTVMGATFKAHKTNIGLDFAVCVAAHSEETPCKVLGHFPVHSEGRVLYLAYEGEDDELKKNVSRIKHARGVGERSIRENLSVRTDLPALNSPRGLDKLGDWLDAFRPNVVVAEPFYLAFRGADTKQLTAMGSILADFGDVCREYDVTPWISHHSNRDGRSRGLGALSGTGLAEWASQWMLLDRIGAYDPSEGRSRLRLEVGSRAGFGGIYTVDIREGRLNDPGGRVWDTKVSPFESPVKEAVSSSKLRSAIVGFLQANPNATKNGIRKHTRRNSEIVAAELAAMVGDGTVILGEGTSRGQKVAIYSLSPNKGVDLGQKAD